jgi:hypothetical protein
MNRLLPLLLACTVAPPEPAKTDSGEPIASGKLALRYQIDPARVAELDGPAQGVFYGQLQADDGTLLETFEHHLDLGDGRIPTELMHTTGALMIETVLVSGFLDANESDSEAADAGDPVALASDNRFTVTTGSTAAVTIELGEIHGAEGAPPSFEQVRDELLIASCAFSSCHGSGAGGLQIDSDMTEDSLIGVPATAQPELTLVVAGEPESSYLIAKMEGAVDIAGDVMPPSGVLIDERVEVVREWIESLSDR